MSTPAKTILSMMLAGFLLLTGCADAALPHERFWVHEIGQTETGPETTPGEIENTTPDTPASSEETEWPRLSSEDELSDRQIRNDFPTDFNHDTFPETAASSKRPAATRLKTTQASSMTSSAATKTAATTAPAVQPYEPRGTAGSESLDRIADSILAQLIDGSMSDSEIMSAVYNWVRRQITYSSPASSVYLTGAEAGLRYRRGNCYTRAFTQVALLRRAGIQATYNAEYEGRHAWALVGEYVLDTGFNVYMVKESALQDYVSAGIYLYRTGPSPRPSTSTESRTVYLNVQTTPYQTLYRINPDHASLYPNRVVSVAGVDGVTRDQWTHRYENGVRQTARDLLVEEGQVVSAKVDQIVLVGQTVIDTTVILSAAGTLTVPTADQSLHGQRVPGTGADGLLQSVRRVTLLNETTGEALAFSPPAESVVAAPIPYSTYVYAAPGSAVIPETYLVFESMSPVEVTGTAGTEP